MFDEERCPTTRRRRRSAASALAEFALCMPILLLLLSAVIEYGFMIYASMILVDASREGARLSAKGRSDADVDARVKGYFPIRNIANPRVRFTYYNSAGVAQNPVDYEVPTAGPAKVPGGLTKITVTCGVQWLTPLQVLFGKPSFGMAASATYRVEL
jgi:hypothetical protein